MTTSTSNAAPAAAPGAHADAVAATTGMPPPPASPPSPSILAGPPRTLWSRFIILLLCMAVVLSTLAYGTVQAWSMAIFQLGACALVLLWMMDGWRTRTLRLSRNLLQLPLAGLFVVGLLQLLLPGDGAGAIPPGTLSVEPARTFSFDPNATRFALAQVAALTIYFAAALAFIDTPARLKLVARVVIIFGFVLAMFGLMQHFISPTTIFWLREPKQALPFGPYVNRHHFAGYMELTLALPLGLLFAGAVARERIPLYLFATALMCIALVMTNSRGGMISMVAEIFFLVVVSSAIKRPREGGEGERDPSSRVRAAAVRVALGFALVIAVFVGVLYFGGEESLSRLVGSVNTNDPTTGRAHFWKGTVELIKDHPILGVGLGAFSAAYPLYDTGNGSYRLEQAHNDYLQVLADTGLVGAVLGLIFLLALFRMGLRRIASRDPMRRGIALGALAGCFGVLVHSFFDFTLHTTANALLFLLLAALATMNGRVEDVMHQQRRRRRRRRRSATGDAQPGQPVVG